MLKTVIIYKGAKPDDSELLELFPSLDITYIPFNGKMVTEQGSKGTQFSWSWMKSLAPDDYDVRCFMVHQPDLVKAGITTSWGLYNLDNDKVHDFYITNLDNSHLDARAAHNGFRTNFCWMFVHEFLHGSVWESTHDPVLSDQSVHQWEREGTLKQHLADYETKLNKLSQVVELLKSWVALIIKNKK